MPADLAESDIAQAVRARRADLIAITRDLIRIESITGSEGTIQAYLARHARTLDLAVDMFEPDLDALAGHPAYQPIEGLSFAGRPNVIARAAGSGGGRSLILNGHVDTIPVEPSAAWTSGPFSGEVRDDRIFGRGASDMKGGVAVMAMAMEIIRDLGVRLRGDVILEYVVDEEFSGYGTLAAIQRGYRADAGICLETSDLCVQPGCVGRLWFTLEIAGKAVSLTRHWEGVSAIDKGILFVQAFKDLEQIRWNTLSHPLYPDRRAAMPCAVFMFHGGNFPSAVPDRAVLRGSLGLLPSENVETVKQSVIDHVRGVADADPWLRQNPPVADLQGCRRGRCGDRRRSSDRPDCRRKLPQHHRCRADGQRAHRRCRYPLPHQIRQHTHGDLRPGLERGNARHERERADRQSGDRHRRAGDRDLALVRL